MNTTLTKLKRFTKIASISLSIAAFLFVITLIYRLYFTFSNIDWFTSDYIAKGQKLQIAFALIVSSFNIIMYIISTFILIHMFQTIEKASPFNTKIVRHLNVIVLIFIILGIFSFIMYFIMQYTYGNPFNFFNMVTTIDFTPFLVSIIIYGIAFIFRYGCELQALSDETL